MSEASKPEGSWFSEAQLERLAPAEPQSEFPQYAAHRRLATQTGTDDNYE